MAVVNVKVRPDSEEFRIENGYMPKFYLENKAERGRANKELINRVEQLIGEKPAIVSGHQQGGRNGRYRRLKCRSRAS